MRKSGKKISEVGMDLISLKQKKKKKFARLKNNFCWRLSELQQELRYADVCTSIESADKIKVFVLVHKKGLKMEASNNKEVVQTLRKCFTEYFAL